MLRKNYAFVMKSIKKDITLAPEISDLKNKTYIISGGTRGIGFNIAEKLVKNGANVVIVGKTTTPHPKLEDTIYTAAEKLKLYKNNETAFVLGLPCDIRKKDQIDYVINETLKSTGTIDGVVLNASALCLNNTLNQTEKEVKLMSEVNINGTYLFGQKCLKNMKNKKSHLLLIAPPLDMLYTDDWWTNHLFYSMSKFNMSLMAKYWNKEFKNIGVNTLWPRTTIATAPVRNLLGGEDMIRVSRTADIMGDAAYSIFCSNPMICNGKNFIDDEVLASLEIDVEKYKVNNEIKEKELMPDFFC
jgi:citronellol/citronellal dehydrogenase